MNFIINISFLLLIVFITRQTNKLTDDDDCSVCNILTIELDQILGIVWNMYITMATHN